MKHVMLDLETWGLAPGSALRNLGAVEFELDGRMGQTFYRNIDRQSCVDAWLRIDLATEKWWASQSTAAKTQLEANQRPIAEVLGEFFQWFTTTGAQCVWAQGAAFDPVLVECAAGLCQLRVPWKFWNVRDTRTVYDLFGFDPRNVIRSGTAHNARDDARYQVQCVAAALAGGRAPQSIAAPQDQQMDIFE